VSDSGLPEPLRATLLSDIIDFARGIVEKDGEFPPTGWFVTGDNEEEGFQLQVGPLDTDTNRVPFSMTCDFAMALVQHQAVFASIAFENRVQEAGGWQTTPALVVATAWHGFRGLSVYPYRRDKTSGKIVWGETLTSNTNNPEFKPDPALVGIFTPAFGPETVKQPPTELG
jgi:hypothetical protein